MAGQEENHGRRILRVRGVYLPRQHVHHEVSPLLTLPPPAVDGVHYTVVGLGLGGSLFHPTLILTQHVHHEVSADTMAPGTEYHTLVNPALHDQAFCRVLKGAR